MLLIHADDFGMSAGVTQGILHAMDQGVVTATSAMVCDPDDFRRVRDARGGLEGRLGLHLQLTDGRPVLPAHAVPALVDSGGSFARKRADLAELDGDQLLAEWQAQLDRFHSLGFSPSHVDTHHSVHAIPAVARIYRQFAMANHLPARGIETDPNRQFWCKGLRCADRYTYLNSGATAAANLNVAGVRRLLTVYRRLAEATDFSLEIGCHPAYIDADLATRSRYVAARADELALLCDPLLRQTIGELGYDLVTPSALRAR